VDLDLKNLLANKSFMRKEKALLLVAFGDQAEKPTNFLQQLAAANGLREIKKWNLSAVLRSLGDLVTRLPGGWTLTDKGKDHIATLGVGTTTPSKVLQPTLRKYASSISNPKVKEFVDEAIDALEFKLFRSAVVLSWVGAVAVLYEEVIANHLAAFNAEAVRRFSRWNAATNPDDLSRMKEYDFLQILHAISVIGKNTKEELESCLKLRNTCGHPNSHKLGEHRVTSHVETLLLNVFSKYPI
jgi:hypothetical protein